MLRRCFPFLKGDLVSVILHDCNPQHGGPYNTTDKKMHDEDFHAFLDSVKGWTVLESGAIQRSFQFETYRLAYEWVGRVMGYTYLSDKYAKVHWHEKHVDVTLYSARFKGITRREARFAAFMSDHFNLLRKAQQNQRELLAGSEAARQAVVDRPPSPEFAEGIRRSTAATPPGTSHGP